MASKYNPFEHVPEQFLPFLLSTWVVPIGRAFVTGEQSMLVIMLQASPLCRFTSVSVVVENIICTTIY